MKLASSPGVIFSASVLKPDMSVAKQVPNTTLLTESGSRWPSVRSRTTFAGR